MHFVCPSTPCFEFAGRPCALLRGIRRFVPKANPLCEGGAHFDALGVGKRPVPTRESIATTRRSGRERDEISMQSRKTLSPAAAFGVVTMVVTHLSGTHARSGSRDRWPMPAGWHKDALDVTRCYDRSMHITFGASAFRPDLRGLPICHRASPGESIFLFRSPVLHRRVRVFRSRLGVTSGVDRRCLRSISNRQLLTHERLIAEFKIATRTRPSWLSQLY
jgi:hypothetical protein